MFDNVLLLITSVAMFLDSTIRLFLWKYMTKNKFKSFIYILFSGIPIIVFVHFKQHLTLFYLSYFILCILQNIVIPYDKSNINHSVRIRFVMYCSIHLTTIGVFALTTNYTLSDVLTLDNIFLICTCITSFIFSLLRFFGLMIRKNSTFDINSGQIKEFQYLYNFLNINIIYIFVEALLCEFPRYLTTNLSTLLCSNILSILLVSCYIESLLKILNENEAKNLNIELSKSLSDYNIKLDKMRAHAHYDSLTGARSRIFLIQEAMRLLDNNILFSLVYIDLNRLKHINDTQGHKKGDEYLSNFVKSISSNLRADDIISRFGGDEFILLLNGCTCEDARTRLNDIRNNIKFPFSAGISDSTETKTLDALISSADKRMYLEKQKGNAYV